MRICIIPARKNSKRIPGKNIRDFLGRPIIEYAIETTIESGLFENEGIIILTDNSNLDKYIEKYNIRVVARNPEFANDNSTLSETLFDVLDESKLQKDEYFYPFPKEICLLLPCAVFTSPNDLIESHRLLEGRNAVIPVVPYPHPIERAFYIDNKRLKMAAPEFQFTRTQDLATHYHDAGQFYWLDTGSFLKQKKIFMDNSAPYIMQAIDIDTEEDWKKAENMLWSYYHTKECWK